MKTIAIDIRLIGKKRTGDETVFFHLTKALLELERETKERRYLLLTDEKDPGKLAVLRGRLQCIGQRNVEVVSLPSRNRFVWNLWTVPRYLFSRHVDIYHTQYILPFFLPRRTRAVTLIHDVSFRAYPRFIAPTDRLFLWLLIPRSLRRASRIQVVSQFTKGEIIKYYHVPPEKIVVIPNAPQDIFRTTTQGEGSFVREKYDLPEKYVLYMGTLQPRKNIPFLLSAFSALKVRLPDAKLVIVGNRSAHNADPRIEEILQKEKLENSVVFPGYVEEKDLPILVRGARVFVFPSLYEGFGIPLLEAMTQRVPVIASDIPSFRETAGEAASYVVPGDIAGLAEKMYNFYIEPDIPERSALVARGTERAPFYLWQESAELLRRMYQSLE